LTRADAVLRLLGDDLRYVSRGGLKLEKALEHWRIDLDGQSMSRRRRIHGRLQRLHAAAWRGRVIAVDTGYGQMDFGLRNDPRIRLLEKTNARYLTRRYWRRHRLYRHGCFVYIGHASAAGRDSCGGRLLRSSSRADAQIVVLVKPQFEVGQGVGGEGRNRARRSGAAIAAVRKVEAAYRTWSQQSRMDRVSHPRRRRQPRVSAACPVFAAWHAG
jgi:23S rRNA (cytidine1920-2'-O)/16S rRNA (cytidine1409-2'-O)-methyltransferase